MHCVKNFLSSYSDAIDFELLIDTLKKLKEGKSVEVPVYDFNSHSRAKYTVSKMGTLTLLIAGC